MRTREAIETTRCPFRLNAERDSDPGKGRDPAVDRHLVVERLSDSSRLGFGVQLALLRHPGTALANLDQSPEPLVIWLATQLAIPMAAFAAYARRPQTMTDHARRLAISLGLRAPVATDLAPTIEGRGAGCLGD